MQPNNTTTKPYPTTNEIKLAAHLGTIQQRTPPKTKFVYVPAFLGGEMSNCLLSLPAVAGERFRSLDATPFLSRNTVSSFFFGITNGFRRTVERVDVIGIMLSESQHEMRVPLGDSI